MVTEIYYSFIFKEEYKIQECDYGLNKKYQFSSKQAF